MKVLVDRGLSRGDENGPMKVRVRMRGPENGGAKDGTPELYMGDPDGIVCQLQDPGYCGGAGALGNVCTSVEPSPKRGLLAVKDYSHITVFSSDAQRSNKFYRDLFGFSIRLYQGPTAPTLAVGPTVQFLMFTGGGGAGSRWRTLGAEAGEHQPSVPEHGWVRRRQVLKSLESYGVTPRGTAIGPVGPMKSYVSMRMENRGGAKEGTPELYLTDPDGILIQLQDTRYCGGGGYLGDSCTPSA